MFSGKAEMGRDFYVKIVNADKQVDVIFTSISFLLATQLDDLSPLYWDLYIVLIISNTEMKCSYVIEPVSQTKVFFKLGNYFYYQLYSSGWSVARNAGDGSVQGRRHSSAGFLSIFFILS